MDYEVSSDFGTNGTLTESSNDDSDDVNEEDDAENDIELNNDDNGTHPTSSKASTSIEHLHQKEKILKRQRSHLNSHHQSAQHNSCSSSNNNIEFDDLEFKYEILSPEKIVKCMIDCIKEVNQVVQLPATTTRILLHYFHWDKEKLMERFYDGDQDGLFAEAHTVNPFKIARQKSTSQDDSYCNICYTNKKDDTMTGLECSHKFCRACWREYLTTKIIDEGIDSWLG
jgi:hypothetical protein